MQRVTSDARDTEQIEAHGLKALRLRGGGCEAIVYLHGAHVASFRTAEYGELLWVSRDALYVPGKAIRGGIPVCFPWFGAHATRPDLPAHGFARVREFRFEGSRARGDGVEAELVLTSDSETQTAFPHSWSARLRVSVGVDGPRLGVAFEVTSAADTAFEYELALHTYLSVSDVRRVQVLGLAGATYADKVSGERGIVEGSAPLTLAGETDRVYTSSTRITVADPPRQRQLLVDKRGSDTTVVWNPWLAKTQRMADFGDDEWPNMLCIEAANVRPAHVSLQPGDTHVTESCLWAEPW